MVPGLSRLSPTYVAARARKHAQEVQTLAPGHARPCPTLTTARPVRRCRLAPASQQQRDSELRDNQVLPPANSMSRVERACAARGERKSGRKGACRGSRVQGRIMLRTCHSVDIALRSCKPAVEEIFSIPWTPSAVRMSPESALDKECNDSVRFDAGDRRDVPPRLERPRDSGRHCPPALRITWT